MPSVNELLGMASQILAAYDGSEESAKAIEYACDICNAMDASITVVHAVQPDIYEAASDEAEAMTNFADEYRREILRTIDAAEEQGQEYLAEAETIIANQDQNGSTELLYGDPVNKILEYVETEDIDTVVVGHQGQSERAHTSIGSVAQALIERAPVPVIVTR